MYQRVKNRWGPTVCSWVPLDFWHKLLHVELLLPYYHLISEHEPDHVSGLGEGKVRTIKRFKADLEFFLKHYRPVALTDVLLHLDGVRELPERCFLLTFDDGFREMYEVVAPILRARGVPAIFFLTTSVLDNRELVYTQKISLLVHACLRCDSQRQFDEVRQLLSTEGIQGSDISWCLRKISYRQRHVLDKIAMIFGVDFAAYTSSRQPYLTSDQVRGLMAQGFAIGSHSLDHPLFEELNLDQQLLQTCDSISWLSNRFQYECQAFAFPFRDTNVSLEFFQTAFAQGAIKVSFGTGGMHRHFYPRNLTRFTMEDGDRDAAEVVAREFFVTRMRRPHWACV